MEIKRDTYLEQFRDIIFKWLMTYPQRKNKHRNSNRLEINDEGFVIMGKKYFLLNTNSLEF